MKRARAKSITKPLATALAEWAKDARSPLEKGYRNTIYCAELIGQTDRELRTEYCGNRWCLVCNRIRTGKAIRRYLPPLEAWRSRWFVTLTVPNVAGPALRSAMRTMLAALRELRRQLRRERVPVRMLRKLECTYNPDREDFHPHFHLIVEGEAPARHIVRRWLAMFPAATRAAQDIRVCGRDSLSELFKYFTKLTAKDRGRDRAWIPFAALDTIFQAMRGRRVYQPCGFKGAPDIDEEEVDALTATASPYPAPPNGSSIPWQWAQPLGDWIDYETGACLSGYDRAVRLSAFLDRLTTPVQARAPDARVLPFPTSQESAP
jgi:hypothetical protein